MVRFGSSMGASCAALRSTTVSHISFSFKASDSRGGIIVSKIKALLSSSCLRAVMPLDALGAEGQWQVDILVTGWTLRTQKHVLLSNENDEWKRRDTPADVVIIDARKYYEMFGGGKSGVFWHLTGLVGENMF